MAVLTLLAPAKLNLFLHINGKRADGYHELETLFTLLDFGDELTFEHNDSGAVTIDGAPSDIILEDNLIYKAAQMLRPYTVATAGAQIVLKKRLPMGGGVGGGSSDAATTLLALNALWNCQLSVSELANLGVKLGADVPVFVRGVSAHAQGIGENLLPVSLSEKFYLVVSPGVHVSTAAIFGHPDLPRDTPKLTEGWSMENTRNDCEVLVKKLYPEVEKTLEWLLKYAPSKMTGTGACCFAEFTSREAAERVLQTLPENWQGFVAKSVSCSPVHKQLNIPL
ncbi:4-(cytidine 5'-diphospho)-2-C-methyl-D-erythritol kinase [Pseudoalteromonas xiamenensis]|uniref:4-(cytidine 5'-diphospho)-2-C-methyl-D-erythritol kinase n=1 Tax=Pseudoalteromonas xiamenensis TaxID=882626 RepID=UPI0027E4A833|nr:4-(cytidine 5'-diphospho)-2-C-methyl-D-erythritol kinase [Pseudoalteromonas xiamenensis]WMN59441.1 4-(cytidine 5'-diphospho)-2-C-methyl-D-erythritol kinase [Pseudoalteromonas xiamenensis]